jgi:DNA invertase Pin-like site-specific DNA recombinase
MKCVAYYRYSTDNRGQVDNSEERQRDTVERLLISRRKDGWELLGSYVDKAVSGTDDKPELMKLRKEIEEGNLKVDCICIDALSRLTRRGMLDAHKDVGWIRDNGIKLSICAFDNGNPMTIDEVGQSLTHLVDVYQNNQYVKKLSRDVTNGLNTKFKKGNMGWVGRAPFGYSLKNKNNKDVPTTLIPNKDLPIIKKIFKNILSGNSVISCIPLLEKTQKYLDQPERNANGTSIKNILRNSIYAGVRTFGVRGVGKHNTVNSNPQKWVSKNPLEQAAHVQDYNPDGFKSCITLDEYVAVQKILDDNQKAFRKMPDRRRHKYSGLLRCACCNTPLNATTWKRGEDRSTGLITYTCPKSTTKSRICRDGNAPYRKSIRTDELEQFIEKQFGILLMDEEFHYQNLYTLVRKLIRQNTHNSKLLSEDLEIQQKRLNELVDMYMSTHSAALKDAIDKQSSKLDSIKETISAEIDSDSALEFIREQYEAMNRNTECFYYYGSMYRSAIKIAGLEGNSQEEALRDEAEHLMNCMRYEVGHKSDGAADHKELLSGNPDAVADFLLNPVGPEEKWQELAPEDVLQILLSMGLDHIKVSFELGMFRGKPRRVPTGISMSFSVAANNSTHMGLVLNSNQFEVVDEKTAGITR